MLGASATQIVSILAAVTAELGVTLVPAAMRQRASRAWSTARCASILGLAVAHRKADPSPLVANFVQLAQVREGAYRRITAFSSCNTAARVSPSRSSCAFEA